MAAKGLEISVVHDSSVKISIGFRLNLHPVEVCVRVTEVNEGWREGDFNTTDVRFQDPTLLLVIANLHDITTFIL